MTATHRNRLVTAISNAPSTTGALTIAAAASGYRTFAAADNGLSFDVVIVDGTAWEIRTGCVYTHAGTSLARGTLEDSSTGSAIALTSAAVVTVTASAAFANLIAANLITQAAAITSGLTTASDTVPVTLGGVVKQITLDNFVAAIGVAPSSLAAAGALGGTDIVVISQGGNEVKTTLSAIAAYVASTLGVAPGTVTTLAAGTATSTTIPLTWAAGSGGTATSWTVTQRTPSGSGSYVSSTGTFTGAGGTVTGLTASSTYDFQVVATNINGSSAAATLTNVSTAAPAATAPAQVTGLTLGTATSTTQPLTWTAPSDGGSAITDYVVQWAIAGSGTWNTFADGTSTTASSTVTGLTASTSYDYRVAAVNAIGTGTNSATSTGSTASAGAPAYLFSPTAFTPPVGGNITTNGFIGGQPVVYLKTAGGVTPANAKMGWSTSSTVAPAAYGDANIGGNPNSFKTTDRVGGWTQGGGTGQSYYGLYGAASTLYAWGGAGTYYLWVITDDGFAAPYDNNTGTPIGYTMT